MGDSISPIVFKREPKRGRPRVTGVAGLDGDGRDSVLTCLDVLTSGMISW